MKALVLILGLITFQAASANEFKVVAMCQAQSIENYLTHKRNLNDLEQEIVDGSELVLVQSKRELRLIYGNRRAFITTIPSESWLYTNHVSGGGGVYIFDTNGYAFSFSSLGVQSRKDGDIRAQPNRMVPGQVYPLVARLICR